MSPPTPPPTPPLWWRRRWVTVSEVIGIGALAVAALSFFDSRRIHHQEAADRTAAAQRESRRHALTLRAQAVDNGARLMLTPVGEGAVVQSQRCLFPHAVLDHAVQVDAAPPQIDVAWVQEGLRRELRAAAAARKAPLEGSGRLPVGLVTTYVEDGETRTDRALYLVGYHVTPGGLFGGRPRMFLQGVEMVARGQGADLQARVDARWAAEPKLEPPARG